MLDMSVAILLGYVLLAVVLLSLRYVIRHSTVMFLLLWLCMYVFLTARLSLTNFYGELSDLQSIFTLVLIILAGLSGAIVRTTMEEGRRLNDLD